jgi:zinc and cadmium transporter
MSPGVLLVIYCSLILLASLAGGWLPIFVRLTHRLMEIALSFVAGVILGVGLLHLLPHAFHELHTIDETMRWVLAGFLLMFFVERFFHFHHHGPPAEIHDAHNLGDGDHPDTDHAGHDHGAHTHSHDHSHPAMAGAHDAHGPRPGHGRLSWIGAGIGMTLHGAVEGLALAAAVTAEYREAPLVAWAGLSAFLAIVLHKPFDSLTILTLMSAGGASSGRRHLINAAYALVIPVGVVLYLFAFRASGLEPNAFLGRSLAFAAGTFLCIATSDLLPELQFHSHDRFKLSVALVLGLALAWVLVNFESAGHDHHQHSTAEHADMHIAPGHDNPQHGDNDHDRDHDHDHRDHE